MANKGVLAALIALCGLAWAYLWHVRAGMPGAGLADTVAVPVPGAWGVAEFGAMFVMWAVMMLAMMLPSVTPMVLLYARTATHRVAQGRPAAHVGFFVAGYVLAWTGFSAFATLLNWALHQAGLLSSMMGRAVAVIAGIALLAAGAYQWTPLKNACLAHCRSPVTFLGDHWREGFGGAIAMGLHHGAFCVGCCWLLMLLLFVLGVMNLAWIAVLTVFVLLEKIMPRGERLARAAGVAFMAWGVWLLA